MRFPNGPQTPAVSQMLRWIANPMSFMEACAKTYGEIFTLRLDKNLPPIVIVSNPQAQQQILTTDTKELEAPGDVNQLFEPLLGKHSVITISGTEHQRQRQLLMPPFTLKQILEFLCQAIDRNYGVACEVYLPSA
ncbi:cytochrome P450 [uncultured Nostoc sp.]|uniref:cytochrome P450 n=1 Tax=uncultured Nostoc sp. TaxID=340711 RepID=UPI0035C98248